MLLKSKQAKLKYKPKFRKISVSTLLKEFNQRHIESAGLPYSASLLDINEIYGMFYDLSIFVLNNHLTDKVKPIHSTELFNAYDII